MASKYHLLINLYKLNIIYFSIILQKYYIEMRTFEANFSKFVSSLTLMLMRHFTVLVNCCHYICFLN